MKGFESCCQLLDCFCVSGDKAFFVCVCVRSLEVFTKVFLPAICGHVYMYMCYRQILAHFDHVFNMFISCVAEFINTINVAFKMP